MAQSSWSSRGIHSCTCIRPGQTEGLSDVPSLRFLPLVLLISLLNRQFQEQHSAWILSGLLRCIRHPENYPAGTTPAASLLPSHGCSHTHIPSEGTPPSGCPQGLYVPWHQSHLCPTVQWAQPSPLLSQLSLPASIDTYIPASHATSHGCVPPYSPTWVPAPNPALTHIRSATAELGTVRREEPQQLLPHFQRKA